MKSEANASRTSGLVSPRTTIGFISGRASPNKPSWLLVKAFSFITCSAVGMIHYRKQYKQTRAKLRAHREPVAVDVRSRANRPVNRTPRNNGKRFHRSSRPESTPENCQRAQSNKMFLHHTCTTRKLQPLRHTADDCHNEFSRRFWRNGQYVTRSKHPSDIGEAWKESSCYECYGLAAGM